MEENEFKSVGHPPQKSPTCLGENFYKYLGLKLCSSHHFEGNLPGKSVQHSGAETNYLLTGPAYFTVTMEKANPALISSRLHYMWNSSQVCSYLEHWKIDTNFLVYSFISHYLHCNLSFAKKMPDITCSSCHRICFHS